MKNGINLIPEDVLRARLRRKIRGGLVASGISYTVVLAIILIWQMMEISGKKVELTAIEAREKELLSSGMKQAELGRRLADMKKIEAEITQKISAASVLSGKKVAWAFVLKRLSSDVPEGAWLRGIYTSEAEGALKRVRVTGSATSNRTVAEFISALERSGLYKDLNLAYTQKREGAGGAIYDFELYMDLKRTGETVHEW